MSNNQKEGIRYLIIGIENQIKAWRLLGTDKQAPEEFKKMQEHLKTLKENNGNI